MFELNRDSADIAAVEAVRARIARFVKRTALEPSRALSELLETNVWVKTEVFQTTGSFKVRGAFNKLLSLSDEEKKRGIVAVSGGNHAQAVAYAATALGIEAVVLMPENTPQNYVRATLGYGAKIDFQPTIAAAFAAIKNYLAAGRMLVHPFDDPLVIEGQATVGLEILEDLPDATDVFVSIGGGGLAGGAAWAMKTVKPEIRVWGVETVGADAMAQALKAGHPIELAAVTSIAKTLGAPQVSPATLELARKYLESVTVVSDREAVEALQFILERLKILTEPAAACTLAAARRLKDKFNRDSRVVLILCGGNVSPGDLCGWI